MRSICLSAFLALTSVLHAGTSAPAIPYTPVLPPPAQDSLWNFRIAPYGWITAVNGDISLGRLSAPVDISMHDTLDTLEMAFMGMFEVSYGKWSFGVDTIYGKTSSDTETRGLIFDSFRFEQKQWIITPTLGYRVVDTGSYHMDITAGARVTALEAELTGRFRGPGETSTSKDTAWVDPIIGLRGQANFNPQWFFRYNGDIGGFGVSSDLVWQAFAGFGYNVSEHCSVALGYRGLGIDYSKDTFATDTVTHGPVIGMEFHW
ncbi:MAG: hypothetical protein V4726_15570 [Verrucomicrobiota bacterium]